MNHDDRPTDLTDDALQELLGLALHHDDPVPRHVVAAARGAFTWRTIDQELADLVFDSAMELTGVREHGGSRQLTFQAPGLEIEVMIVDPESRRLVGQLVPARAATVRLEGTEHTLEQPADRFGKFSFEAAPPGPVRITVAGPDELAVSTDWVLL